jgi:hypothetical protein
MTPKQIVLPEWKEYGKEEDHGERLTDEVEEDLWVMGIRNWYKRARDRKECRWFCWKLKSTMGFRT